MAEIIESELMYKKQLSEDLVILGFKALMSFKAGQFFQLIIDKNNIDNRTTGFRPYSILTSPTESLYKNMIETFVKLIPGGLASEFIKKLKEGDKILIRGPYGKFSLNKDSKNHVFLSTGTGITPMYSMIKEYIDTDNNIALFYSSKHLKELIFHEEFQELEKNHQNFHYYPTLTREQSEDWQGLKGRIQLHLDLIDLKNKTFYICGLKDFITDIRQSLLEKDVSLGQIIFERYD